MILLVIIFCFLLILLVAILINEEKFEQNIQNKKKIALCFLINETINNEDLWYEWLKNVDKDKYNIYIHYKKNKKLNYFDEYKIKENIETCWGCLGIVLAQNALLKEALKDSNNKHFIWLSDACVPLKTFEYVYNYLDIDKSYFNMAPDEAVFPRAETALKYIKRENLKKAAMPAIINRKHAQLFVDNDDNIKLWFKNVGIPDEIAYISLIHHYNLQNELITTPNIASGAIIISQWTDMSNYKDFSESIKIKKSPCEYKYICSNEVDYFVKSNSLFARKFVKNCEGLDYLKKFII